MTANWETTKGGGVERGRAEDDCVGFRHHFNGSLATRGRLGEEAMNARQKPMTPAPPLYSPPLFITNQTSPVVLAMVSLFWLLSPLEKHALVVVDSGGVEALSSVLERGYEARRLRLAACGTLLNLSRFASCRALLVEHAALHPVLFRIVQSFWSVDIGLMILGFYLNVTEDAPSEKVGPSLGEGNVGAGGWGWYSKFECILWCVCVCAGGGGYCRGA